VLGCLSVRRHIDRESCEQCARAATIWIADSVSGVTATRTNVLTQILTLDSTLGAKGLGNLRGLLVVLEMTPRGGIHVGYVSEANSHNSLRVSLYLRKAMQ